MQTNMRSEGDRGEKRTTVEPQVIEKQGDTGEERRGRRKRKKTELRCRTKKRNRRELKSGMMMKENKKITKIGRRITEGGSEELNYKQNDEENKHRNNGRKEKQKHGQRRTTQNSKEKDRRAGQPKKKGSEIESEDD